MSALAMSEDRAERDAARFLFHEATLLDRRAFEAWLALLSPAIDYKMPVRTTRGHGDGDGFSNTAFFLNEDIGSLKLRIARLDSEYAWAENPPTRTRRLISNIRADPNGMDLAITSNFAVYCYRGDDPEPRLLTGERQDVLGRGNDGWRLRRRLILLDTTVLGMDSLSILL